MGSYTCHGAQGPQTYSMKLIVEELGEATFEFTWRAVDQDALVLLAGIAVPAGDHVAVALVGPRRPDGERGIGVAHYVMSPGRLEGVWARGDGLVYKETCVSGRAA